MVCNSFLLLPFSSSWNKVLAPIWNSEDVPASVLLSGRLREKDKALIKEKFSVSIERETLNSNQSIFKMNFVFDLDTEQGV